MKKEKKLLAYGWWGHWEACFHLLGRSFWVSPYAIWPSKCSCHPPMSTGLAHGGPHMGAGAHLTGQSYCLYPHFSHLPSATWLSLTNRLAHWVLKMQEYVFSGSQVWENSSKMLMPCPRTPFPSGMPGDWWWCYLVFTLFTGRPRKGARQRYQPQSPEDRTLWQSVGTSKNNSWSCMMCSTKSSPPRALLFSLQFVFGWGGFMAVMMTMAATLASARPWLG